MNVENFLRTLARFDGDIKRGAIAYDYRTGQCGPGPATVTKSWGAGCPTGYCPPENLPESLGRWFAGDRSACAEKPLTFALSETAAIAARTPVNLEVNAPVTMCPTRIICASDFGDWNIEQIRFGMQNQIAGGPVPWQVFGTGVFASVPLVPDCMRAGQPITINTSLGADAGEGTYTLWVIFLGPMVG